MSVLAIRIPRFSRIFAFLVIALGGYEFALPNVGMFVRYQFVHGVFLSNIMVITYVLLFVASGGLVRLSMTLSSNRVKNYALLIFVLGVLGIVSAAINQTSVLDLGQAARLFLLGTYFVLLVHFCNNRGPTFVLRAYLIGLVCGGTINLYYTFLYPEIVIFNVLPALYAANGSGGTLGLAISLGALLWIIRESPWDAAVAIAIAAIGGTAIVLSYSKTAMSIGVMGILAWLGIAATALLHRYPMRGVLVGAILAVAVTLVASGSQVTTAIGLMVHVVEVKFGNMTAKNRFGIDNYYMTGSRYAYWPMTANVLAAHPIVGVGYGGLYDAYLEARKGYEQIALVEIYEARTTNPHNSFLYFVGANGLLGLVVVVLLFAKSLRSVILCASDHGRCGRFIGLCLAGAYVIYSSTLSTLFNTEILYLPVAVALVSHQRASVVRRGNGLYSDAE